MPGAARILSTAPNSNSFIGKGKGLAEDEIKNGEENVDLEDSDNKRVLNSDFYETIPYTKETLTATALSDSRFNSLASTQEMTLFISLDGNSLTESNRRR